MIPFTREDLPLWVMYERGQVKHEANQDTSQVSGEGMKADDTFLNIKRKVKRHHHESINLFGQKLNTGSSFDGHQMKLQNSIGVPCHVR